MCGGTLFEVIYQSSFSAPALARASQFTDIDQRRIGESIDRNVLATPRFAPALAIAVLPNLTRPQ